MNQEIEVGSKWERDGGGIVTVVYVNLRAVVFEYENLAIHTKVLSNFLDNYKPHIEPKPPLKVEAWVNTKGRVVFQLEGEELWDVVPLQWTREPRLDYEVE